MYLCCSIHGGELFDRAISEDFLLTEKACVCIVRQICEAIEFIHSQNIIHLDMKVCMLCHTYIILHHHCHYRVQEVQLLLG